MRIHRTRTIRLLVGALLTLGAAAPALSAETVADWPTRTVRVIVPYSPGGSSDTLGRIISKQLSEAFKQTFVVENKGGAGGMIGSQMVTRAKPDGYTLVVSGIGSHVVAPVLTPGMYDPMKDFTHIAILGGPPTVLSVNAERPPTDLKSFVAYVKSLPEGLSWGSPGLGTHASLIGEAYRSVSGLNLVQVSYKGASPAIADVAANQVPAAFTTLTTASGNIRAGKLRAIAVTSSQRIAEFPNVPTFAELGYPQLTGTTWFSLSGPADMDPQLVNRINVEVRRALRSPEGKAALDRENMETFDWDAATFTKYVQSQIDYWAPYVKASQSTTK